MTLPRECGKLTWRSYHSPSEAPTAKHMRKQGRKSPRFSSLPQLSWSGMKEKPDDELLIESTVLECYEQKHRRPSTEEMPFAGSVIDLLALRGKTYASAQTKGLKDAVNPMDPINDRHDKMEKFMRAHSGYDRSSLQ